MWQKNSTENDMSKGLVIYTDKKNYEKYKILESLQNIISLDNKDQPDYDYYKNNKINIDYYLHLSKSLLEVVNKNIYDLSSLNDITQESKNLITNNMIESLDKINEFFEIKLNQFSKQNYDGYSDSEIAFLGKKRWGFISRNNFKDQSKILGKKQKGFLRNADLDTSDDKCFEPKGVKYTISDFVFAHPEQEEDDMRANTISLDDLPVKNKFDDGRKGYFKFSKNNENHDSKSLILKTQKDIIQEINDFNNVNVKYTSKIINMPSLFENKNINSIYCKDFMTYADQNSEFFQRAFAKLNFQKQGDDEIDIDELVSGEAYKRQKEKETKNLNTQK